MAKRGLLVAVLAALVAGGVFAEEMGNGYDDRLYPAEEAVNGQELRPQAEGAGRPSWVPPLRFSVGGGLGFDGGTIGINEQNVTVGGGPWLPGTPVLNHISIVPLGFGAFVFADATFAELSIGIQGGPSTYWINNDDTPGSFFALDFTLLGKFPFSLGGGRFYLFPLLGIGGNIVLAASLDGDSFYDLTGDSPASKLSAFRLYWGAGADFDLNERLFLRVSALGNLRFAPSYFRDRAPAWRYYHGIGGGVRVGVGFRL